jgi:hypothetical protein
MARSRYKPLFQITVVFLANCSLVKNGRPSWLEGNVHYTYT